MGTNRAVRSNSDPFIDYRIGPNPDCRGKFRLRMDNGRRMNHAP